MVYKKIEELKTTHLLLRKFRADDAKDFFSRVGGSEAVTRYMLWEPHQSLADTKVSIDKVLRRYEEENCYTWAIASKEDDTVIGRIDLLRFDEAEKSCSFAYMLGEAYWGKGYGTEALAAVFRFAFEQMHMQTIVADHMCENVASGAVMKKVGMTFVTTHKGKYKKAEKYMDADEYRITRQDWINITL